MIHFKRPLVIYNCYDLSMSDILSVITPKDLIFWNLRNSGICNYRGMQVVRFPALTCHQEENTNHSPHSFGGLVKPPDD